MAAPKIEKPPVRELSLGAIKADMDVQSRAAMSVEDEKEFSLRMIEGDEFPPVVVFLDSKGRYWLADGFHRYKAAKKARKPSIRAVVHQGEREDAIVFSAGANKRFSIKRTAEDIKRACCLLFAMPEWWSKPDLTISKHIGVSSVTVTRRRNDYAKEFAVPIPDSHTDSMNRTRSRRYDDNKLRRRSSNGHYRFNHKGKAYHLGKDYEEARRKADAIRLEHADHSATKKISLNYSSVSSFLNHREFSVEAIRLNRSKFTISGASCSKCVMAIGSFDSAASLCELIGRVRLLRQHHDPTARAVVICYPEDGDPELIELARADGVEFLTPEEFVASLQPDAPAPDVPA